MIFWGKIDLVSFWLVKSCLFEQFKSGFASLDYLQEHSGAAWLYSLGGVFYKEEFSMQILPRVFEFSVLWKKLLLKTEFFRTCERSRRKISWSGPKIHLRTDIEINVKNWFLFNSLKQYSQEDFLDEEWYSFQEQYFD